MTATAEAGALVRICEVLTEPHRIATDKRLTTEQARAYFFNPSAIAEVLEFNGAYRDPLKLAAIGRLRDRMDKCYRDLDNEGLGDGI